MDLNNLNPLQNIDHWEDDLIKRYPENKNEKSQKEFRDYQNSKRAETVREFYKLNHKYQSYDFVCEKKIDFFNSKSEKCHFGRQLSF